MQHLSEREKAYCAWFCDQILNLMQESSSIVNFLLISDGAHLHLTDHVKNPNF